MKNESNWKALRSGDPADDDDMIAIKKNLETQDIYALKRQKRKERDPFNTGEDTK